jgi:dTDP-4-amino-4,6-dideoxygalactose transaminase
MLWYAEIETKQEEHKSVMNNDMSRLKVPFALPECGKDEIQETIDVIKSGWLTTASRVFQLEMRFAKYMGVQHCLAVNSGTAALHLALEASGVGPHDKVIVPVHTFTATAEVVRYLGADPVFVDIDKMTFNIDPVNTQETLSAMDHMQRARLKAIIPVHFGGHSCDMDGIMHLAQNSGLKVLEDATHAFPAFYENSKNGLESTGRRMVGTIGNVTSFSFYANKTITTAEGGMLATDDEKIARRVQIMRLHGIDRDIWSRFSNPQADWIYDVVAPGFKYNMPDLAAALGIHQLRKADKFRKKRQLIAETYYGELAGIPGLVLPQIRCSLEDHSWHLYVILIESKEAMNRINRDKFIKKMHEKEIGTSVHYIPLHRMTYYRNRYGLKPDMFPNSEWVFQRCVSLPIYSAMSVQQLSYVIDSIKEIMGG